MTSNQAQSGKKQVQGLSIQTLRKIILSALILAIGIFSIGVFVLVNRIFDNFGPAVEADLAWKAVRGSRELAQASELGLAAMDGNVVASNFGGYKESEDVIAIVAMAASGAVVTQHGQPPEDPAVLFAGKPGELRRTPAYYVSWTNSDIEGGVVGRIALVISTRRLVESQRLLRQVHYTVGVGALGGLIAGFVFVILFTGAIIKRDAQLAEYAATLERKVDERTAQLDERNQGMCLVLDNVSQGFVTVAMDGVMAQEKSAIVHRWLGHAQEGQSFADYIGKLDPKAADWFKLGLDQIIDDIMPIELLIDQMPRRAKLGERTLKLDYNPILRGEKVERLLIVMTDITAEILRERMEREQREMLALFQAIANDRQGFKDFLDEASKIVDDVCGDETLSQEVQKRLVHTLKGNAGLYRVESLVQVAHDIESRMIDEGTVLLPSERQVIADAWKGVSAAARNLLGEATKAVVIDETDYRALNAMIQKGANRVQLERLLASWKMEPVSLRFERLAGQARQLANRLAKAPIDVRVEAAGVRLDAKKWGAFWSAFVHVVRNAVDHGIEETEDRVNLGKAPGGILWLSSSIEGGGLVIRMRDDGKGIDWDRLAAKAMERGLPHQTRVDLEAALFADGVSTREEITVVSGRGVGMGAIKDATEALGGSISVRSEKGKGTTFEFVFPAAEAYAQEQAA